MSKYCTPNSLAVSPEGLEPVVPLTVILDVTRQLPGVPPIIQAHSSIGLVFVGLVFFILSPFPHVPIVGTDVLYSRYAVTPIFSAYILKL